MARSWAPILFGLAAACGDSSNMSLGDAASDAGLDGGATDTSVDAGRDAGVTDLGSSDSGASNDSGPIGDGGPIADGGVSDGGVEDGGTSSLRFTGLGLGRKRTSCGIDEQSALVCWGRNDNPPPLGTFSQVDGGDGYMCGLRLDGTITCWVTAMAQSDPTDPELIPPAGNYVQIAAAFVHACALDSTGLATCWGSDPESITPPANERFSALVADDDYTCGLALDGRALCWGSRVPSGAPSTAGLKGIGAGDDAACVIDAADELSCFGLASAFLMSPPAGPFVEVDVGQFVACGRRVDGSLACFGPNGPELAAPPGSHRRVEMGEDWGCALGDDALIRCWGSNFYGQIDVP